jgi:glycosyltransferase involved in cell wall biosynthesis
MNILLWSDSYPPHPGGLERATERLARGLAQRQHQVAVLTSHHPGPLPDFEQRDGVSIYRLPFYDVLESVDAKRIALLFGEVARLKQSLRPDLVHIQLHCPSAFFHLHTMEAWRCTSIATVHGEFKDCRGDSESLTGQLLARLDWVITVSHAMLDDLRSIAPETAGKSSCIYNGTDIVSAETEGSSAQEPLIFACGRIVPEKGFDLLLRAFHKLTQMERNARLVLTGDGPERGELQRYADKSGIAHRVSLPGWVDDADLFAQMAKASMMVVPSRWREGFGLVVIEAAMRAVPVIATSVGALPELIEDRRTGILVAPERPDALCHAMLELLQNGALRRSLGETARIVARRRFSEAYMLDCYEQLYRRLISPPTLRGSAAIPLVASQEVAS